MKIMFATDNLSSGGVQRQIINLSNYLVKDNEITICVYDNNNNFFLKELNKKVKFNYPEKNLIKNHLRILLWFIRNMKNNYDCIISFQPSVNIIISFLNLFFKRKHINVEMSIYDKSQGKFKRYIANIFNCFCGNVVCNSFYHKKYLRKNFFAPKKIQVIWNGFQIKKVKNDNIVFKKKNNILVVGNISYPKNGLRIIKAINLFYKRNGYIPSLNWVGRKDKAPSSLLIQKQIEKYISNNKILKTKINFLGEVSESKLNDLFLSSDFLLSASIYEGLPNVICEAMICKTPIIASKISDNYKIIGNNERGLLCNPLSSLSICRSIEKFYSLDNSELTYIKSSAFNFAKVNFSISKISEQYLNIINQI